MAGVGRLRMRSRGTTLYFGLRTSNRPPVRNMTLEIEIEREEDGRWIAEVPFRGFLRRKPET